MTASPHAAGQSGEAAEYSAAKAFRRAKDHMAVTVAVAPPPPAADLLAWTLFPRTA